MISLTSEYDEQEVGTHNNWIKHFNDERNEMCASDKLCALRLFPLLIRHAIKVFLWNVVDGESSFTIQFYIWLYNSIVQITLTIINYKLITFFFCIL